MVFKPYIPMWTSFRNDFENLQALNVKCQLLCCALTLMRIKMIKKTCMAY